MSNRLTVQEYATLKEKSVSNIYQKINRGTLEAVKQNGKTYIITDEILENKNNCSKEIKYLERLIQAQEHELSTLRLVISMFKPNEIPVIEYDLKKKKKKKKKKK